MSRNLVVIAVVLPLLAITFGIVRAELTFARTRDYTFEITGYDPRDVFRGHYLQFRLQLEPAADRCTTAADSCCFCLSAGSPTPRIERTTCAEARECEAWLDPSAVSGAFRFYVSDVQAPELEKRLMAAVRERDARAVMAVDANGRAHVRQLLVGGLPISGRKSD